MMMMMMTMIYEIKYLTQFSEDIIIIFIVIITIGFSQSLRHGQQVIKKHFLIRVKLLLIQIFPSLRLVAIPKLKTPVYSTIYSKLVGGWIHAFPNDIELVSTCPFPSTITVTPPAPLYNAVWFLMLPIFLVHIKRVVKKKSYDLYVLALLSLQQLPDKV